MQKVFQEFIGAKLTVGQRSRSSSRPLTCPSSVRCRGKNAVASAVPAPRLPTCPPLIGVHVQVDLCAQVEVEKGVDAEDKEEDGCHDQERVLRWKERRRD